MLGTSFQGKVVVVTGGNSGPSQASALRFARKGTRVVIAARRVPEGEETVTRIRNDGGINAGLKPF